MTASLRSVLLIALILAIGAAAFAAKGDPIQNNHYQLDLTHTVTSGSTRKIGMGGAFTGLAEGNAAIPDNPAAVSYRPRAFMRPWEFDMALGSLITTNDDTDNSGSSGLVYGESGLVDAGLMAQYENWGVGGVSRFSVYSSNDLPEGQEAQFLSGNAALGYTTDNREVAFGFSFNPVGARLKEPKYRDQTDFRLKGLGYGAGVIWHPRRGPWHFGAAYTSSVSSDESLASSTSPVKVGNLIVPNSVFMAGSLALGTAYEWNQFPLWRKRPAIGTFDARIFGQSPSDANSAESFITQTSQPGGQKTIVTLHTGLEVETIPKYLRLRVGTYREPSRYDGVSARMHITGGFELRLTPFHVWDKRPLAISYAFDSAERYQVHSISIWVYTFTIPVPDIPSAH
jgi:hypothetical protein